MQGGFFHGEAPDVRFLIVRETRNPVVFKTSMRSEPAFRQVAADVVEIEIITDIPVEIAVVEVSRIALLGAPYLF